MTINNKDRSIQSAMTGQGASKGLRMRMASALIVDGEPEIRNILQRGLKKYFSLVETAEDSHSAENLRQRCRFDLIIADVHLPGLNGLDWVSALRRQGATTCVIFMTAHADVEMAISALRLGVEDFILKPFSMEQMMTAVEQCLERQKSRHKEHNLTHQVNRTYNDSGLIGSCEQILNIRQLINRVAPMPSTVLIEGESGTGKELAARAIHGKSVRPGSFVPVNCSAMPAELLESELFGHQKGAFTGAHMTREGLFTYAHKGTLFLDEIGEMPLSMQAHLLRVLEEHSIRPVGANQHVPVDVRIIAATNRDLGELVQKSSFREDLYYRLNVLSIRMPALRERLDDIPVLTHHFIDILTSELGVEAAPIGEDELARLRGYEWPGNVRELKNVIERSLLLDTSPSQCMVGSVNLNQDRVGIENEVDLRLESVEKHHILKILKREGGNKSAAARLLGVSRKTLERKVHTWGLS